MELHNGICTFHAKTRKGWRNWLEKNAPRENAVWLVIYHKDIAVRSVYYDEAVEEAICFGWIDSVAHKRDGESKYQFFARRKAKSNWSNANRARAEKMIKLGKMTPEGQTLIDLAKSTGTWEALVEVQNSVIPPDLQAMLNKSQPALKNFSSFSPSSKRIILEWIFNAKKQDTRQRRIEETVRLAANNIRANHYRQPPRS